MFHTDFFFSVVVYSEKGSIGVSAKTPFQSKD